MTELAAEVRARAVDALRAHGDPLAADLLASCTVYLTQDEAGDVSLEVVAPFVRQAGPLDLTQPMAATLAAALREGLPTGVWVERLVARPAAEPRHTSTVTGGAQQAALPASGLNQAAGELPRGRGRVCASARRASYAWPRRWTGRACSSFLMRSRDSVRRAPGRIGRRTFSCAGRGCGASWRWTASRSTARTARVPMPSVTSSSASTAWWSWSTLMRLAASRHQIGSLQRSWLSSSSGGAVSPLPERLATPNVQYRGFVERSILRADTAFKAPPTRVRQER
jgi:hypothetical protein